MVINGNNVYVFAIFNVAILNFSKTLNFNCFVINQLFSRIKYLFTFTLLTIPRVQHV